MNKAASFIVIGGANMDIAGKSLSSTSKASQSQVGSIAKSSGGVARNIAETLGRLEQNVTLLSAFGDDEDSRQIMDELASVKVGYDISVIHKNTKADLYMAIYDKAGELISAINDMPLIDTITADLLAQHKAALLSADKIVIDANLSSEAIDAICKHAPQSYLAADAVSITKAQKLKPYLSSLNLLKVTESEACQLIDHDQILTHDQLLHRLHEAGVTIILLSLGEEGFILSTEHQRVNLKAQADIDIITISGAGDGLFAGTLYGISQGYELEIIAQIARRVAQTALTSQKAVSTHLNRQLVDPLIKA